MYNPIVQSCPEQIKGRKWIIICLAIKLKVNYLKELGSGKEISPTNLPGVFPVLDRHSSFSVRSLAVRDDFRLLSRPFFFNFTLNFRCS